MNPPALDLLPWRRRARIRRGRVRSLSLLLLFGASVLWFSAWRSEQNAATARFEAHTHLLARHLRRLEEGADTPDAPGVTTEALRDRLQAGLEARLSRRHWQQLWQIVHRLAGDGAVPQRVLLASGRAEVSVRRSVPAGAGPHPVTAPELPPGWQVASVRSPGEAPGEVSGPGSWVVHWEFRQP